MGKAGAYFGADHEAEASVFYFLLNMFAVRFKFVILPRCVHPMKHVRREKELQTLTRSSNEAYQHIRGWLEGTPGLPGETRALGQLQELQLQEEECGLAVEHLFLP